MNIKSAWQFGIILAGSVILLAGCGTPSQEVPSTAETSPAVTTTSTSTVALPPDALIRYRGALFSTSGECAYCHTGMKDTSGTDVSFDSTWRSSMMANAARDPYYRASVRSEVQANPEYQAAIEKKCAICHTGMAFHTAENDGSEVVLLPEEGFLNKSNSLYPLAMDGVSCTLCHQITAENFGKMESYSGEYGIDQETLQGQRIIYGSFVIDDAMSLIMSSASGFVPEQGEHIKQSELCAVCHNLFTPTITNEGTLSEELFPEQTSPLEWQHSAYQAGTSCQGCHMPAASGDIPLANTGSAPRSPFLQHTFAGGNAYMVSLLAENREILGVTASAEQLENTRMDILTLLQEKTAGLSVNTAREDDNLVITVKVNVKTGHKFPTSFPSRRAWLHVLVTDEAGKTVFESGAWETNGKISENDNDLDGTRYEPHYTVITSPDQVQIYEAIMGDPNGNVTTTLLRAQNYLKDNRLLPVGFDKETADSYIAVYGDAESDEDFKDGGDQIIYQIPASPGTYSIKVELLYQSIGYRWSERFRGEDNPEGIEYYAYADAMENIPVIVSSQVVQVK